MSMHEYEQDLATMQRAWADSEPVEKKPFEDIPPGRYQAYIDKVYLDRAKTSKRLLLKWELVIAAGPYQGRRLFRNNTIDPSENMRWLKTDLLTVGLDVENIEELPARLSGLIGLLLDVSVSIKGDGDQARTNVYLNKRVERDGAMPAPAPTMTPKGGSSGLSRF